MFCSRYILDHRSNLQKPFLQLTRYCSSVLCCRATPLQKAYIVRVVKQQLKMRTLAIGLYVLFILIVKARVYRVDLNILTDLMRYYENDGRCSDMKPLIRYEEMFQMYPQCSVYTLLITLLFISCHFCCSVL